MIRICSPAHPTAPSLDEVLGDLIRQVRDRPNSERNGRVAVRLEEAQLAERWRTGAGR